MTKQTPWQKMKSKFMFKGTEDWCWPVMDNRTRVPFGEEVVLVAVYPDCKLYMGATSSGNIQGSAKVVDGKTVWVSCLDVVPQFKKRFYENFPEETPIDIHTDNQHKENE